MPFPQFDMRDESHLNLLSIFHYVLAGICSLGFVFIIVHYLIMSTVMDMAGKMPPPPAPPAVVSAEAPFAGAEGTESADVVAPAVTPSAASPAAPAPPAMPPELPKELMRIMLLFYIFFGVMILAAVVCNILSARFIKQRKHRMFSFIVAGFNCLHFPFGTALGVFTFVVLARPGVEMAYNAKRQV